MNRPIPHVLTEYVSGLVSHDIGKIATTVSEDLLFISATRILRKAQFLDMLNALYSGFPDWLYEYDAVEDRGQGNYAIQWRQSGTHTGTAAALVFQGNVSNNLYQATQTMESGSFYT